MRQVFMAGLAALSVTFPIVPANARIEEPLPAFTLRLSCHDEGLEATTTELEGMGALLTFAESHDGQPVYLDAVITANDGSGSCSRDVSENPDQRWPTPIRAVITFDPCRRPVMDGEEARHCWRAGMVDIRAMGPPLAISQSIVLPAENDLPRSLPYRLGGYGDWLNYQGPFIVRYHSATGSERATFDVPDAALSGIWDRARRNVEVRAAP